MRSKGLTYTLSTLPLLILIGCTSTGPSSSVGTILVSIDPQKIIREIPTNYLGLSIEKESLNTGDYSVSDKKLMKLFKDLGPGILRVGADTVDEMSYFRRHTPWPSKCGKKRTLKRSELHKTLQFLKQTDWKLIYGLNLGCFDPNAAVTEALSVQKLAKDRLVAFEVGNEPDMFILKKRRSDDWDAQQYIEQFKTYHELLKKKVPHWTLSGPGIGVYLNIKTWFPPFVEALDSDKPESLSSHFYPMVRIETNPEQPIFPSYGHMFSKRYQDWILEQFKPGIAQANQLGVGFRVSEMNSVAMSGTKGVSDSFASALWFLDYAYAFLNAGVDGVNVQGDISVLNDIYSPIQKENGQLIARPIYYGMLAFAKSAKGELVKVSYNTDQNFVAYASKEKSGLLHIVLINKELSKEVKVDLPLLKLLKEKNVKAFALRSPNLDAKNISLERVEEITSSLSIPHHSALLLEIQ